MTNGQRTSGKPQESGGSRSRRQHRCRL